MKSRGDVSVVTMALIFSIPLVVALGGLLASIVGLTVEAMIQSPQAPVVAESTIAAPEPPDPQSLSTR